MESNRDLPHDVDRTPEAAESSASDAAALARIESDLMRCQHRSNSDAAFSEHSASLVDRWEESSPLVREKLLDRVGALASESHEVPPPMLLPKELPPGVRGAYIDDTHTTELNRELLASPEPDAALQTYLHEYRHAEQAYELQKSHGALAHQVDAARAEAIENSSGENYISPDRDREGYWQQFIEADAREFAAAQTDDILSKRDRLRDGASTTTDARSESDKTAAERINGGEQRQG